MEKLTKSPRLNFMLGEMHIFTPYQVVEHLPRRYEDYSLTEERSLSDKQKVTIYAKVLSTPITKKSWKVSITSFDVQTVVKKTYFKVVAYNRPYLSSTLKKDAVITLTGIYDKKKDCISLVNYINGEIDANKRYKAIYSLPKEFANHIYSGLVKRCLEGLDGKIHSLVPYTYINKYKLIDKGPALWKAHFPSTLEDIKSAYCLLKYEEALIFSLKNQIIHKETKLLAKIKKEPIDLSSTQEFLNTLPYQLTDDQIKAASEIIEDMNQASLMYRLLQGDVGTGKTLVCFISLFANYKRGDQGAMMAPTDALARQHYKNAIAAFKNTKIRISLLVGSTPLKEKEQIYRDLEDGVIDLVIGTHALFAKSIKYSSLGLVIIDEQHRFGVNQRQALANKGEHADLLMLSATPIPRSLALSLYGDLDVSTLTSFPNKIRNVKTYLVESDDKNIFETIQNEISKGKLVYVVTPKIVFDEEGAFSVEKIYARYVLQFGKKVGVLHGKMTAKEKELALENFYNGTTPILVSTQVIEVGIDVKNASTMIIYDANQFGLASLHQLRGRIGRDGSEAICYLTYDDNDEEAKNKLNFICGNNDGFSIAEFDLKSRGPGELTGLKQAGMPDFRFLNIINDFRIFEVARNDAKDILAHPNEKGNSYIIKRAKTEIEHEIDYRA